MSATQQAAPAEPPMRETLSLLIPMLCMYALGFLGGSLRERHRIRAEHERAQRLFARCRMPSSSTPSPVTLQLHGFPTTADAADFLARMFGGCAHTVEEGD